MANNILDILDLYTHDRKLSQEIFENYEKYFQKIKKLKDFKLEDVLKVIPYIEKLKIASLNSINVFHENKLPNDLIMMVVYLLFRSKLGSFMTINILTQPVIKKINSLFIDVFPNEIPKLMKDGLHIEAKKLPLYDNITRIILYNEVPLNGYERIGIILFKTDMRYMTATLPYSSILGTVAEEIDKIDFEGKTKDEDITPFRKGIMFCFIFAILIEAENTPTVVKDSNKSDNVKRNKSEKKITEGWIERTVYINKKYLSEKKNEIQTTLYKDDKILKKIAVTGFLRNQAYGKNFSQHKYIYIDNHQSYRWVTEGDKKVTYYLKQE
jgi:hypothetical protein